MRGTVSCGWYAVLRAGRIARDVLAIPCDGYARLSRAGCRRSGQSDLGRGRSGDTCVGCVKKSCLAGLGCHSWDVSATPSVGSVWDSYTVGTLRRYHPSVGWLPFCTRVQVSAARDALRYHAVGLVWAGLPKVGAFRRHHHGARFQTIALRC